MEEEKDIVLGEFLVGNTPAYVTIKESRLKEILEHKNKRKKEKDEHTNNRS